MKDKIKSILKFEGFGGLEKIISLVLIAISFVITIYIYFANVFNI